MEKNYTIEEILIAVNDLQNSKKDKKLKSNPVETDKQNSTDIPKNTLSLIEEAEKIDN